jgi:nucleotide-binding universal stress UspA family protein
MFESALVPLDGSPRSEAILKTLTPLAAKLGMQVTLLHILESPVEATDEEVAKGVQAQREQAVPVVTEYLEELAHPLRDAGVTTQVRVAHGHPAEVIVQLAQEGGYSLIAMSTRGRGILPGTVIGSVASRVLQSSSIPMLMVKPRRQRGFWTAPQRVSRIVVPLDGSEGAEVALPYAEELARRLSIPISLVQVLPMGLEVPIGTSAVVLWDPTAAYHRRLDVLASSYLASVGHRLLDQGLQADWDVMGGPVVQAIVSWAERNGPSMVVMASRSRRGLLKVVGGVTEAVVRETHLPVLVVPPRA